MNQNLNLENDAISYTCGVFYCNRLHAKEAKNYKTKVI